MWIWFEPVLSTWVPLSQHWVSILDLPELCLTSNTHPWQLGFTWSAPGALGTAVSILQSTMVSDSRTVPEDAALRAEEWWGDHWGESEPAQRTVCSWKADWGILLSGRDWVITCSCWATYAWTLTLASCSHYWHCSRCRMPPLHSALLRRGVVCPKQLKIPSIFFIWLHYFYCTFKFFIFIVFFDFHFFAIFRFLCISPHTYTHKLILCSFMRVSVYLCFAYSYVFLFSLPV